MFQNQFHQPNGNPFQLIQQFNEFRQNFTGDPKQMVQQLLQSGRMNQQQYNQLFQLANQFQKLVK